MKKRDSENAPEAASLSVDNLDIHFKTRAALRNAGIDSVEAILETERGKGLLRVRNLGKAQYQDIQRALFELGVPLDGSPAPAVEDRAAAAAPAPAPGPPPAVPEAPVPVQPEKPPAPSPPGAASTPKPSTVAFIDYESWYVSLREIHRRRPNIQAWFDNVRERGRLLEVTFFGDFSDNGGMKDEINNIRRFTNRIIETKNTGVHKKNFTDFIMLDSIYQKIMMSPEIEQIVLFTGDGDFCSVASYLRNFCGKVVGVYGVDGALSGQLEATSDWCVRLPFANEPYEECRLAILKNLKYTETHSKSATFRPTVRIVAEHYGLPEDAVEAELRRLLEEGVVYSSPERSRWDYRVMLNILRVHWDMVEELGMELTT